MQHRLRSGVAAAVVFAVVVLVSGCTDDRVRPSDELPPPPSPSATATSTGDAPGATGYPLPEAARAYTAEGARAFFDYFIAVLNASSAVNDPVPLREISQGCEFCDEITQRYEQAATDGVRIVGGALILTDVGVPTIRPLDSGAEGASMAFRLVQQAQQVLDAAGNLISDTPELAADGGLELTWLADQRDWLVSSFGLVLP